MHEAPAELPISSRVFTSALSDLYHGDWPVWGSGLCETGGGMGPPRRVGPYSWVPHVIHRFSENNISPLSIVFLY